MQQPRLLQRSVLTYGANPHLPKARFSGRVFLRLGATTAVAIGHIRRITTRTVRKHLENIYAKLGKHDRLQAVNYAREIGLLDPQRNQECPGSECGIGDS